MTITDIIRSPETLSLTFVNEFSASPDRVWQLWADNEKLGRWWGPPTWPATFAPFTLTAGERVRYFMTGPDGEEAHGYWVIDSVDQGRGLTFRDGFADKDGNALENMGQTTATVTIEPIDSGTRMTLASSFATLKQFEQLMEMQMDLGMTEALGQIEAILAEG